MQRRLVLGAGEVFGEVPEQSFPIGGFTLLGGRPSALICDTDFLEFLAAEVGLAVVSLPGLRSASCIAFHVCGGSWRVSPTKMLFCARSISISASGGVALPASSKIATGKRISLT